MCVFALCVYVKKLNEILYVCETCQQHHIYLIYSAWTAGSGKNNRIANLVKLSLFGFFVRLEVIFKLKVL